MADGDINLAALWVPVVPETSQFGPKMEEAAKESKRRWNDAFKDFGKGIHDDLDKIGSKAKDTFGGVGRSITDSFKKSGQDAGDQFVAQLQSKKSGVGRVGEDLAKEFGTQLGRVIGESVRQRIPIVNDLATAFQHVNTAIDDAKAGRFKGALDGVAGTLRDIDPLTKHIGIDVSGWAEKLGGFSDKLDGVSGHLQGVNKLAGDVGVDISGWTSPLQEAVDKTQGFQGQVKDVADVFSGLPGKIGTVASAIGDLAGPIGIVIGLAWELEKAFISLDKRNPNDPAFSHDYNPGRDLFPNPPGVSGSDALGPLLGGSGPQPPAAPRPAQPGPNTVLVPPTGGGGGGNLGDLLGGSGSPAPAPSGGGNFYDQYKGSVSDSRPPPAPAPAAPMPNTAQSSFVSPSGGGASLASALSAKGFSPEQIRLVEAFSQVEGNNAAGSPTLGFTDTQVGGRSDLQAHVDALAQQFKDRASAAGPFPQGGTDQQQAQWIANVVGQAGVSSDWQGNPQPKDYVPRVVSAMQGGGGGNRSVSTAGPAMMPSGGLPNVRGAHPQLAYALAAAQSMFPDLTLTAGKDDHPVDQGWHPKGQAIDIGGGTPQEQAQLSNWLLQFAPDIEELIHSGPGVSQNVKTGRVGPAIDMPGSVYSSGQAGYHGDHVHLAVTDKRAGAFEAALGGGGPGRLGSPNSPIYVAPASSSSSSTGSWSDALGGGGSAKQDIAQQFGSGFLKGIFSDLGFGNVLGGKSPLDFGALKLFSGVASMGMGMTQGMGGGSGGMGSGFLSGIGGINLPKMIAGAPHGASGGARPGPGFAGGGQVGEPHSGVPHWMQSAIGVGQDVLATVPSPMRTLKSLFQLRGSASENEERGHENLKRLGQVAPDPYKGDHAFFASGGPSGTDTVPAWLSPGEFVINKASVDRYGSGMMSAINAGRFASGGIIPLGPSGVSRVPVGAGAPASVSAHAVYDNRIVLNNVALTDPNQLVRPLQEQMNARTYQRAGAAFTGGGLPYVTGPGGG